MQMLFDGDKCTIGYMILSLINWIADYSICQDNNVLDGNSLICVGSN